MENPLPPKIAEYTKFILAAIGIIVTVVLATVPEGTTLWTVLTIISGVATALLVLIVPNKPPAEEVVK